MSERIVGKSWFTVTRAREFYAAAEYHPAQAAAEQAYLLRVLARTGWHPRPPSPEPPAERQPKDDAQTARTRAPRNYGPHRPEDAPTEVTVWGDGRWPREEQAPIPDALIAQREQLNRLAATHV